MCGITAILSKKNENIINLLLDSIHQLENRGYDSTGIAYIDDNKELQVYKKAMINDYTFTNFSLKTTKTLSNIGIAHTRWATHGGVSDLNAHPHLSNNNDICIVHNGIIENYLELKQKLISKGYKFYSDTDTEVISNLIEFYIDTDRFSMEETIYKVTSKLQGTYGLVILYKQTPDKLYIIRNGSPMLVGENNNNIIITSEISGFVNEMNNYICLDNHDLVIVDKNGILSKNTYNKNIIQKDFEEAQTPAPYPHWMLKEIIEQPISLLRSLNNGGRLDGDNIKLGGIEYLKPFIHEIKNLILLGCGTSLNACMVAKTYFRLCENIASIQCIDGADFVENDIPSTRYTLIIFCSQSGETKDLYRCLEVCRKKKNIITLGIINVVDSLIAREVNCGVYLNAGREVSVASTKSFTSMLSVLSLVSIWIHQQRVFKQPIHIDLIHSLRNLSNQVEQLNHMMDTLINKNEEIKQVISDLNKTSLFILGKGKMEAVAKEGALKIKEVCYIHAEGCSASSLKHGPFALLTDGFPVILLIDKKNRTKLMNTYKEIAARKAYILVISELTDLDVDNVINIPENKYYQEILYVIVLQYLSYFLSTHKKINPDRPRNLAKVVTVD
jgi:glucosamine--fructose-6-phosphate aminotransferase (isomerizing)